MQISERKIRDIKPYANNPRKNDSAVDYVANSIKEFGFKVPIVIDKDGIIIAGHTRLKAAKKLGMETVPCIMADDLTDEQVKAFRLADNKVSEFAEWDADILSTELDDILDIDMEEFGFDLDMFDNEPVSITEDEPPEPPAEPKTKLGDMYKLGGHRLICGDSTDSAVIDRLMDGVKADISITSPPYNADHMDIPKSKERGGGTQKSTQKKYLADNDKRTDDEYFEFLCANIDVLLTASQEVFYNIGVGSGSKVAIARILNHYQNQWKEMMYWVKDNPMPVITESVISSATELIICFGENGSRSFNYFNDRLFHGVINGHSAALSNEYADIHKATFPTYLPSEIIKRFTPSNGTVLDSFGGTGTTLIACEQLNRRCYMAELDPVYCDVIIERWENLTGEKAELIE